MPPNLAREVRAEQTRRALGIPDWRCPGAYPRPKELLESGWRWEFLRRRPTYRADFAKDDREFGEVTKGRYFQDIYRLGDPIDPRTSAKQIDDTLTRGDDGVIRWPGIPLEQVSVDTRAQTWYSSPLEVKRILTHARHLDVILRADPLRPLEQQFRAFRHLLNDVQKSLNKGKLIKRRLHTAKWPLYLRVLDAKDVGASYTQIAKILTVGRGTEHAARDVLKQAERLRDEWLFQARVEVDSSIYRF